MSFAEEIKPPWRLRLTLQEECFLFASLMLVSCYFLPWASGGASAWNLLFESTSPLLVFALGIAFTSLCLTPLMAGFPEVRPWYGIFSALCINGALGLSGASSWGGKLAALFVLMMLVLSAKPAVVRAGDLAMKRVNAQNAELFNHWGTTLHGLQFSAQEFYTKVETEVRARAWPGVELLRLFHTEAGLLSHKREYLRVVRQRQVFDLCASNFGRDYFFTLREAEIKPQLTLVTVLIFLLALWMLFTLCIALFGLTGIIGFGVFVVSGLFLMLTALRLGLTRFDGVLLRLPVIGPIYENIFRRSTTYFQHDTRLVFLKLMDDVVKAYVDEETSAKGIKLLSCFEHQPLLDGLYQTSDRNTQPKA